jgi:hypothetical protein
VVLQVAALDEPPFRLLLGTDAVRIVEQADLARIEADRKWRHLSVSTDFDAVAGVSSAIRLVEKSPNPGRTEPR